MQNVTTSKTAMLMEKKLKVNVYLLSEHRSECGSDLKKTKAKHSSGCLLFSSAQ